MLKKTSRLILSMIMSFGVISTPVYAEEETVIPEEGTEEIQTQEETEEVTETAEWKEAEEVNNVSDVNSENESNNAEELIPEEKEEKLTAEGEEIEQTEVKANAATGDICVYKNTIQSLVKNNKIAQIYTICDDEAYLENGITNITYLDMDKNGMPELFITVEGNSGYQTSVYTFWNGSVKLLKKAPPYYNHEFSFLQFYKDNSSIIYCCYENSLFTYYKLSSGSFVKVASRTIDQEWWDDDIYEYYAGYSVDGDDDIESAEEQLSELNQKLSDCKKNCKVFLQIFNDVRDSSKYYYDAVYWAYDKGYTTGITANTFKPGDNCTRAHIVTFLWRLAGKPKPQKRSGFKDVPRGAWYEDAVSWAAEKGITTGLTATKFSPGSPCTRAQIVTFLWRYKGKPKVDVNLPFKDVKSSAWYASAVKWAYQKKITTGKTSTQFDPTGTCTRGQAAVFLKRTYEMK